MERILGAAPRFLGWRPSVLLLYDIRVAMVGFEPTQLSLRLLKPLPPAFWATWLYIITAEAGMIRCAAPDSNRENYSTSTNKVCRDSLQRRIFILNLIQHAVLLAVQDTIYGRCCRNRTHIFGFGDRRNSHYTKHLW